MARSINRITLIGTLKHDPVDGERQAGFFLETSRQWKDRTGVMKEVFEQHSCVAYGAVAEVVTKYLKQGDRVYVDGRLEYRETSQGHLRAVVRVNSLLMLGGGKGAARQAAGTSTKPPAAEGIRCPNCGGEMYDNRQSKRNPQAPDFRCMDKNCRDANGYQTGVWLDRKERANVREAAKAKFVEGASDSNVEDFPDALRDSDDDLPF